MKKATLFGCTFLFSVVAHIGWTQAREFYEDSVQHFDNTVKISDSLKETKNFKAAVYQLSDWLKCFPSIENVDRSRFDYSDTLYSITPRLPRELFLLESELYKKKDSTLFSGYIIRSRSNYDLYSVALVQKGKSIETHHFVIQWTSKNDKKDFPTFPFAFPSQSSFTPTYWTHGISCGRQSVQLNLVGDTMNISKFYTSENIERISLTSQGDTSGYYIQIAFGETEIVRGYQLESGGEFGYYESVKNPHNQSELSLWHNGDTVNFDQYKDGKQHGLQVIGFPEYPITLKFRSLWKDDQVLDILNTNILYLNQNLKLISKEQYLKKYPRDANGGRELSIRSEQMIRKDENGKVWIVIPYKLRNYKRFIRKLNASKWHQIQFD